MEDVFFKFHEKIGSFFLRRSNAHTRSLLEHSALIIGVSSFYICVIAHKNFVYRGSVGTDNGNHAFGCLRSIPGWSENVDITHISLSDINGFRQPTSELIGRDSYVSYPFNSTHFMGFDECGGKDENICPIRFLSPIQKNNIMFSYSKTKGFLFVPSEAYKSHNITSQYVVISKEDSMCFGEPFLQKIVFYIVGPSTVILNWFLSLHDGIGYLYNPQNDELLELRRFSEVIQSITPSPSNCRYKIVLYKLSILISSLFLFFMTTTLTSFILHETQNRMLRFTVLLQTHVRNRVPVAKLVVRHVVESLVFVPIMFGVLVFLNEFIFLGNAVLGFGILSIVWCEEVFTVISMRTGASMYFFPRLFFIYFMMFHVYFFSCPSGFTVSSLTSTFLLMVHSMIFFWVRYELPALQDGIICEEIPRMMHPYETEDAIDENPRNIGTGQSLPTDDPNRDENQNSQHPLLYSQENEEHIVSSERDQRFPSNATNRNSDSVSRRVAPSSHQSLSSLSTLNVSGRGIGSITANGVLGSSSSIGLLSYPSANMLYVDGEHSDDDSYGIFMNGEVVVHENRGSTFHTRGPSS